MARCLIAILTILVIVASAAAATLDGYKQRLDTAAGYLRDLRQVLPDAQATYAGQMTALVLRTVPSTETVEWSGGRIETQNAWLGEAMHEFLTETDGDKRSAILKLSQDRLNAASAAITHLQNAADAYGAKDSDKQRLQEILQRPEYRPPAEEKESLFQRWWREFWTWFDRQFPRPALPTSPSVGLGSLRVVLQVAIFIAIAGVLGFLMWRFLPYFSARWARRERGSRGDRVILGEIVSADSSGADLLSDADRLARDGDIRGAVRKGYMAILCELGERRIVRIARHKTNRDYLRDVRRTRPLYDGLRGLTDSFERSWYGLHAAKPGEWEEFRSRYDSTLREARERS